MFTTTVVPDAHWGKRGRSVEPAPPFTTCPPELQGTLLVARVGHCRAGADSVFRFRFLCTFPFFGGAVSVFRCAVSVFAWSVSVFRRSVSVFFDVFVSVCGLPFPMFCFAAGCPFPFFPVAAASAEASAASVEASAASVEASAASVEASAPSVEASAASAKLARNLCRVLCSPCSPLQPL